nr:transposase [Listeria seeligeri]
MLGYNGFPNPSDTLTLLPFLNTLKQSFIELPIYIIADAGYDSEQNYETIIDTHERKPLITYYTYIKEQKKRINKIYSFLKIGSTKNTRILTYVQITEKYLFVIIGFERAVTVLLVILNTMNVRIILPVRFVKIVHELKKANRILQKIALGNIF